MNRVDFLKEENSFPIKNREAVLTLPLYGFRVQSSLCASSCSHLSKSRELAHTHTYHADLLNGQTAKELQSFPAP